MTSESNRAWRYVALYLANLLLLPGLAFVVFVVQYFLRKPVSACEIFYARFVWVYSLVAGVLLLLAPLIAGLFWSQSEYFWVWMLTFWVSCHGLLVVAGAIALAGALNASVSPWLLPAFLRR